MKRREVESELKKKGFKERGGGSGSHSVWTNENTGNTTTVAGHGGRDIPEGTLKNIFSQAGLGRPPKKTAPPAWEAVRQARLGLLAGSLTPADQPVPGQVEQSAPIEHGL